MSTPAELIALLGVGVLAGIVSTVASLASIVSYPALLALGLPPVSANVTNTVALMFTGLGAAVGSRPELAGQGRRVLRLGLVTAAGGGVGAALLLLTPSRTFEYAAPVLIAVGSTVILRPPVPVPPASVPPTPGPPIAASAPAPALVAGQPGRLDDPATDGGTGTGPDKERGWLPRLATFAVAVYIGYFGAAGGILLLALLIRMFQQSLARTNAVKNVVSGLANAVAGIGFAIFGPVRWAAVVPLAAGFLVGGWAGPWLVRRLPARGLRVFVGICGLVLAVRLGISAYG